jgi:hypothetical protein
VTSVLRDALTHLGYTLVPTTQLYQTARQVALPYPPQPDAVLYLMRVLNVATGVTCEIRGGGGYYQAILRVRFAQEPTERVRQLLATQWTLGDSIRAALPSLLAPPSTVPYGAYPTGTPPLPDMSAYTPPPPRPPTRLHPNHWDLSLGVEFAFGPGSDAFFNFLGYARLAYFPFDRFGITASVAYANLRGRTDRVSNWLPMVGVETAVDLIPRWHVYLPLRAEIGYLPYNGPVGRATAGVGIGITRDVRLELDLLTPTVWAVQGGAAASLDLGVSLVIGFGAPAPPPPPAPPPRHHHRRHRSSSSPPPSSGEPASTAPEASEPPPSATEPTP